MSDLDLLTIGLVLDIWTEKGRDQDEQESGDNRSVMIRQAGQAEFDAF